MGDVDKTQFHIETLVLLFSVLLYGMGAMGWQDAVVVLLAIIAFIVSSMGYTVKTGEW